ncbi:MAG: winged helix-turn-helix domain-containing protein [Pseudomonadota bacterium]
MDSDPYAVIAFGEFRLDLRRRLLLSGPDRVAVPLSSKAYDTLAYLIGHRHEIVTKRDLMRIIWPRVEVEANNLNQVVSALRRAFGERRGEHRFIVTVPGRGYRFVAEVREQPVAVESPVASIAVLPFVNLTGEPEKEYFGDGMAAELIHMLARIPGLHVPSRTSSFAYKGRNVQARDIAHDLKVAAVLEGSVRSAGERIRVTAQLVDGRTGYQQWSQVFDRRFDDILRLQDELAAAIVAVLQRGPYAIATKPAVPRPPTNDVGAYHLYLQGTALIARPSAENCRLAAELFARAVARDPLFARALCAEAVADALLALVHGAADFAPTLAQCEIKARQALTLDETLAAAESLLGKVACNRLEWLAADSHYRSSLALEVDALTLFDHAFAVLAAAGHIQQGRQQVERAFALAPGEPIIALNLAVFNMLEGPGRDAESLRYAAVAQALGWPPDVIPMNIVRSKVAQHAGRFAEAGALMKRARPGGVTPPGLSALIDEIYRAMENPSQAVSACGAIRSFVQSRGNSILRGSLPMLLMHWAVLLEDVDLGYEIGNLALDHFELQQAVPVEGFLPQLWLSEMKPFRRDPRFPEFAGERLKLLEFWNAYGPPDGCEIHHGALHVLE